METLYCGIDLHSNNGFYGIVEKSGKRVYGKRLPNRLDDVLEALCPYKKQIEEIAVESTYNWYWLTDGLKEDGYNVKLANPAAMEQYSGLKNTDDKSDAFFIAEQMRLGVLKTGYIYPKEERSLRDVLRRRSMFVNQRTSQILSFQSLLTRQTGQLLSISDIKKLEIDTLRKMLGNEDNVFMAVQNMEIIRLFTEKIKMIENHINQKVILRPEFEVLTTIPGVGKILGATIMLETGDISRFNKAGNYTSYCRCVSADKTSNQKKKGKNNRKNGNKYLSWAYVEAAQKMKQYCSEAQSFYDRKFSKTRNGALARKALGAKLTKAVYYMLINQEVFDLKKMFG